MVPININNNTFVHLIFSRIESHRFPPLINMSEIDELQRTGERIKVFPDVRIHYSFIPQYIKC